MEHDIGLTEITLVIVAALTGGLAFTRFKQPPILGYILAGILLGPSCMGLIQSRTQVSLLAELGVLLLLFVVGMDLNLRTFKKVWVVSTLCTVIQIFFSVLVTGLLAKFLGWSFGLSLLLGFVLSLSSTLQRIDREFALVSYRRYLFVSASRTSTHHENLRRCKRAGAHRQRQNGSRSRDRYVGKHRTVVQFFEEDEHDFWHVSGCK